MAKNSKLEDEIETELKLAYIASNCLFKSPPIYPNSYFTAEYVGALFDGEGNFGINKNTPKTHNARYTGRASIAMVDTEVINPLKIYGGNLLYKESSRWNENASDCLSWSIHSLQLRKFLQWVIPHLKIHRKIIASKLVFMLEFLRKKPYGLARADIARLPKQEAIYRQVLLLNSGTVKTEAPNNCDKDLLALAEQTIANCVKKEQDHLEFIYLSKNKMPHNMAQIIYNIFQLCNDKSIDIVSIIEEKLNLAKGELLSAL